MEGSGDVTKIKYKPKKSIDLKKLDPESSEENSDTESSVTEVVTSSDEDNDATKNRKVGARRPGPASSKLTRSWRSQVSVA